MSDVSGASGAPVRGLPGRLPPGERILWQGAPDWKRLALTAFHVRTVALYFGLLFAAGLVTGASPTGLMATAAAALAATAVLTLLAWASARSTVYTLTDKRLVMQIGVALPTSINLPLKLVETAGLRLHADGTADMPLKLGGRERVGWALLWPHARPWRLSAPEPMLRAVPEGALVGALLARTLADVVPGGRRVAVADAASASTPLGGILPA